MIHTTKDLIAHLKRNYKPNENLAYTIYSVADVQLDADHAGKEEQVWDEVIDAVDNAIESAQGDINSSLSQAISEYLEEQEGEEE